MRHDFTYKKLLGCSIKLAMAFEIAASWVEQIGNELHKPYMGALSDFLAAQAFAGKNIYPQNDEIFNALTLTPFHAVRAVILGQDPYHGAGQAHGLAFSVRRGVRIPPSLRNIYKEIEASLSVQMPVHGDLSAWARQGVLLLNATLTVEESCAGAHQKHGWEEFTDAIIRAVNDGHEHVVFMLWGSYAHKKGALIDRHRHLVLESAHPSPLSAHRGFIGNGHFIKANDYLIAQGRGAIAWDRLD